MPFPSQFWGWIKSEIMQLLKEIPMRLLVKGYQKDCSHMETHLVSGWSLCPDGWSACGSDMQKLILWKWDYCRITTKYFCDGCDFPKACNWYGHACFCCGFCRQSKSLSSLISQHILMVSSCNRPWWRTVPSRTIHYQSILLKTAQEKLAHYPSAAPENLIPNHAWFAHNQESRIHHQGW